MRFHETIEKKRHELNMNALLFQYEICNVSRGLSETANCAHELFRGHSHCVLVFPTKRYGNIPKGIP